MRLPHKSRSMPDTPESVDTSTKGRMYWMLVQNKIYNLPLRNQNLVIQSKKSKKPLLAAT
jgi:hypothetical protein